MNIIERIYLDMRFVVAYEIRIHIRIGGLSRLYFVCIYGV